MLLRLRARRQGSPPRPPEDLIGVMSADGWGWQVDLGAAGTPQTFERALSYVRSHSRHWVLGTALQVQLFANRLAALSPGEELSALLRGVPVPGGTGLLRDLKVSQAYVSSLESEVVALTGDGRILAFWDGDPVDAVLVRYGPAALVWHWDRIEYRVGDHVETFHGWQRHPTSVVTDRGTSPPHLHQLTLLCAPGVMEVHLTRLPLGTVWGGWLQNLHDAATFAGAAGVLGLEAVEES